jgi:hypothetical protein
MREAQRLKGIPLEVLSLLSLLALLVQQYTYSWRRAGARRCASREYPIAGTRVQILTLRAHIRAKLLKSRCCIK